MKLLQRWQFASQGEKSLEAECDLASIYGYDGIMAKALDGTMWMRSVDQNADALGSYDDVQRSADYCHDRGLQFGIWVNPLQADMTTQAIMAAECLRRCDFAAFDTEPYAGFLGAWPQPGICANYMDIIIGEVGTDKPLIWQPDPRYQHLLEVRIEEWAPRMTHYAPQDYVQDFFYYPSADLFRQLLINNRSIAADWGLIPLTTLPGNATADLLPYDAILQQQGFVVWRIGSTDAAMLSYLGAFEFMTDQPEQPNSELDDLRAQVASRDVFIADIADRIISDQLSVEMQRHQDAVTAIIEEAQRERAQILGPRTLAALRGAAPQSAMLPPQPVLKMGPEGNIGEGANPH